MRKYYILFKKPVTDNTKQEIESLVEVEKWHENSRCAYVNAEDKDIANIAHYAEKIMAEYLVRYEDHLLQSEESKQSLVALAERYSVKHKKWQRHGKCQLVWATEKDVMQLSGLTEVKYVDSDRYLEPLDQLIDYHLEVTDVYKNAHQAGYTGAGVNVCVIDTGLRYTHEDLPPLYKGMYRDYDTGDFYYYDSATDDEVPAGMTGPVEEYDWRWAHHGTMVAGVIFMQDNMVGGVGFAPGANFMHANIVETMVFGGRETPTFSLANIIEAMYWAIENDAHVINVSRVLSDSASLVEAINETKANGIHFVTGAGNSGWDDPVGSNAALDIDGMITAGAVRRYPSEPSGVVRWESSSYGPYLDFMAPINYETTGFWSDDHYYQAGGTSSASPAIAGMIAILRQAYPKKNADTAHTYWSKIYAILKSFCRSDITTLDEDGEKLTEIEIGGMDDPETVPLEDGDPYVYGHGMPVFPNLVDKEQYDPSFQPPVVRAQPPTDITKHSAQINGEVLSLGDADEVWVRLLYKEDLGIYEPWQYAQWPESEYEGYPTYSGEGLYDTWRRGAIESRTGIKITQPGTYSVDISGLSENADYVCTTTGSYVDDDGVFLLQICNRYDVDEFEEYDTDEAKEEAALLFVAEGEIITEEPIFATLSPIDITDTSATIRGEVVHAGADDPQRNLQWGYSPEPGDMSNHIDFGVGGVGIYSAEITGLKKGSAYYYRAYGISSYGYDFGETIQFYADEEEEEAPAEYAYRIHRQVGGGPWEIVGHVEDENTMTWDDESEFQVNQDYHYQVVKIIESDDLWSNVATVTWNEYGMFGIMGAVPFNRIYTKPGSHFELTSGLQTETRKYIPDATETEDVATVILETFTRKSEYLGLRIGTKFNRFPGIITYNPRFQTRADFSINSLKNIKLTSEFTVSTEFTIETRKAIIHVPDVLKVYVVPEFNQPNLIQPELPPLSMPRVNKQRIEMQMINLSTGEYYDLIGCDVIFHVKPNRYTLDPVIEKTVNNGISISGYGVFAIELDTQDLELPATDYLYGLTVGDGNKFHRLTLGTFRLLP